MCGQYFMEIRIHARNTTLPRSHGEPLLRIPSRPDGDVRDRAKPLPFPAVGDALRFGGHGDQRPSPPFRGLFGERPRFIGRVGQGRGFRSKALWIVSPPYALKARATRRPGRRSNIDNPPVPSVAFMALPVLTPLWKPT